MTRLGPRKLLCLFYGHDWRYYEDHSREYTGYLERCQRCGAIVQVPQ
jgi:hypothetical protein